MADDLIPVAEALSRILQALAPTGPETVPVSEAAGRVLARPVASRRTQPPADVSAMDGYALRAAEAPLGAVLRVAGESAAGHPFGGGFGAGEAIRISTGALLPEGADAILLQEDASRAEAASRWRKRRAPAAGSAAVASTSPRETCCWSRAAACRRAMSGWRRRRATPGFPCTGGRASPSSPPATRSPAGRAGAAGRHRVLQQLRPGRDDPRRRGRGAAAARRPGRPRRCSPPRAARGGATCC
jgi:hypothetical protein